MILKSFAMKVVAFAILGMAALAAQIAEADAAEKQGVIIGKPLSKEVAMAMMQEQQAAELARKGRLAEAEAMYKESLAVVEKNMPGDPELATSLNNFGQFYRGQQRFSEAAELFNRALAIYVASYGDNHTLTATAINNLANAYVGDRKYDAAEPLLRRGLAATEKLFGSDNYGVAISLDWLAQVHVILKRYAEAETEFKRGIAIAEKATGPDSQLVVRLLDHMIFFIRTQGREQEAAALKERVEQINAKPRKQ
jgi:tetratricopeptide (TPR) repeat protein